MPDGTCRNRGASAKDVIDELRRYVTGWANYFGISHTYREVLELDEWMRRRVRLYYGKQWKQTSLNDLDKAEEVSKLRFPEMAVSRRFSIHEFRIAV